MNSQSLGVTDIPVSWENDSEDLLNVHSYLQGLEDFIRKCPTPLSIAIQGGWGTGKTSVLNYLQRRLDRDHQIQTVYFNTWQYSQFDMSKNLYFSFLTALSKAVSSTSMHTLRKRFLNFMVSAGKGILGAASNIEQSQVDQMVDALFEKESQSLQEISEFHDDFAKMIRTDLDAKGKQRLVIFVDDLDRLEPNAAVSLLEVMKLFTDVERCVFVMAIDYDVVVQGVRQKYSGDIPMSKCRSFFDKIIQLSFRMPVESYELSGLVKKHLTDVIAPEFYPTITRFTERTIGKNPRAFKRMLNSFLLICGIYEQQDRLPEADRAALFCCLCIQNSSEETYTLLLSDGFWGDEDEPALCGSDLSLEDIEGALTELYPQEGRIDRDMTAQAKTIISELPGMAEALYQDQAEGLRNLKELLHKSSITAVNTEAQSSAGRKPASKVTRIILDGQEIPVSNTTEALTKTYEHYLRGERPDLSPKELVEKLSALCFEGQRENSVFRSRTTIQVGEETLWLGLSSSSNSKLKHVHQLCQSLGLERDAVQWFEESQRVYPMN